MTAHPRIDPVSGEMIFFSNFPDHAFDGSLLLHVVDADGVLSRSSRVAGPYPAVVHDFAITAQHIVLVVSPLTLSLERLRTGGPVIAWEPEREARIGIVRRADLSPVRWVRAPAAMVWHTLNAYEDGGCIFLDLCQQSAAAFPTADGGPPDEASLRQFLTRWTIGAGDAIKIERLSDVVCEYPRLDERLTGRKHRFGYFAADGGPGPAISAIALLPCGTMKAPA
jgi:carotenoid cleavage dioxygenase-like enzyme